MKNLIRCSKAAFTLIELLVVIAIIALLAAILFPVFGCVRENARRSTCQSNLKQIGLGILQYTQDFDERMPKGENDIIKPSDPAQTVTSSFPWQWCIYPYVKSTQVFQCPSNINSTKDLTNNWMASTNVTDWGLPKMPKSYVGNGQAGSFGVVDAISGAQASGAMVPLPAMTINMGAGNVLAIPPLLSSFAAPTECVVASELKDRNSALIYFTNSASNQTGDQFQNHLSTTNFLFADGHVKAMKPVNTIPPQAAINMWDIRGGTAVGSALKSFLINSTTNNLQ